MKIDMKKIVVFGGTGGLGMKLVPLLRKNYNVISLGSSEVDITALSSVKKFLKQIQRSCT